MSPCSYPNRQGVEVNPIWDAIIINFNGELFLDPCIRALLKNQTPPARIIVVDNASSDESVKELAAWPEVEVLELPENLGYAGGANAGAATSDAPVMVFLNPDVELDSSFGREVCRVFSVSERLGVAGAKLVFPDSGIIQHAGGVVQHPRLTTTHLGEGEADDGQFNTASQVDYVTGAALAVRRKAFEDVGGFDPTYFPAYWEDVDLCYRLRTAGWSVEFRPGLAGVHHEGSGQQREDGYFAMWSRNRLRFAARHLTPEQWWRDFVPAEIDRLRGELSAVESPDWYVRSGAGSIENAARSNSFERFSELMAVNPQHLLDSIQTVRELAPLADPVPPPIGPADGISRRFKRYLSRFSGRIYAEELYWQQRQFNEAVVRAIEAQDRLNREIVADLLLTLLLMTPHPDVDM